MIRIIPGALALLLIAASAISADEPERRLDLTIVRSGWGSGIKDVEAVLRSTGRELVTHYKQHDIDAIRVQPKGGPIVLFKREAGGAVVMKLNTGDQLWAQMAFQFGHELCHVLCRYDNDIHGNDWFEETLCEVASLYVLRRMGERWKTDAPYRNWRSYAPALTNYAQQRIDKAPLPEDQTLAQWYTDHKTVLRKHATKRDLNRIAAGVLLPFFEAEPEHWEAVRWLNDGKPGRVQTLGEFLGDWRHHAPDRHAAFIEKIAAKFDVKIVAPAEKD